MRALDKPLDNSVLSCLLRQHASEFNLIISLQLKQGTAQTYSKIFKPYFLTIFNFMLDIFSNIRLQVTCTTVHHRIERDSVIQRNNHWESSISWSCFDSSDFNDTVGRNGRIMRFNDSMLWTLALFIKFKSWKMGRSLRVIYAFCKE